MKKLLLVFPHPGDESLMCGGTVAKYIGLGWKVHLLCATAGEAGSSGEYGEVSKKELLRLRIAELEAAAKKLGISSVQMMGYKDGQMKSQASGEVEDVVYKALIDFAPDVVITYEPGGISNDPDNIKLSLATTFSYQKYASDVAEPYRKRKTPHKNLLLRSEEFVKRTLSDVTESTEPRLYYSCIPTSTMNYLIKMNVYPNEIRDKPWSTTADKQVTTIIDIGDYVMDKLAAMREHVSQMEEFLQFVSIDTQPLMKQEYFVLRMQGESEIFMGKNDVVSTEL